MYNMLCIAKFTIKHYQSRFYDTNSLPCFLYFKLSQIVPGHITKQFFRTYEITFTDLGFDIAILEIRNRHVKSLESLFPTSKI